MQLVYSIAREFDVPVLIHFQHNAYNTGIERFHRVLERYPTVDFIGHAQTWWGNIDKQHDQATMYPQDPCCSRGHHGSIARRLRQHVRRPVRELGAECNATDEDHARQFLRRHQDRLIWASDCNDTLGEGSACIGWKGLATIRRLAPNNQAVRKILSGNAARLLKLA